MTECAEPTVGLTLSPCPLGGALVPELVVVPGAVGVAGVLAVGGAAPAAPLLVVLELAHPASATTSPRVATTISATGRRAWACRVIVPAPGSPGIVHE
jgi:hypothetical protein